MIRNKKKSIKISYDRASRALVIALGQQKSVDSDIDRNVVIDYDRRGKIVRINLYDFNFDDFRRHAKPLRDFARDVGAVVPSG